jgi:hypothetical protein
MSRGRTYKFSGHQTFVFRYGWLVKGVSLAAERPTAFSQADALVRLGVGKNMVASIRHWCEVTQLIEPYRAVTRSAQVSLRPTSIAQHLLLSGAWDPFLEDDASLWLIHWLLATNPSIGTAGQLLFSRYNRPDFTRREITHYLQAFAQNEGMSVGDSVMARDVDCLIRTYAGTAGGRRQAVAEETFDCPLLSLSLVQPSPDGELYRFAIGPKPSLPAAVFAYALHDQFERRQSRTETLSIQECLYGEASPGQVFKLDENSLVGYVEELEDCMRGSIILDETAGLKQIYRTKAFEPLRVLGDYYQGGSRR